VLQVARPRLRVEETFRSILLERKKGQVRIMWITKNFRIQVGVTARLKKVKGAKTWKGVGRQLETTLPEPTKKGRDGSQRKKDYWQESNAWLVDRCSARQVSFANRAGVCNLKRKSGPNRKWRNIKAEES